MRTTGGDDQDRQGHDGDGPEREQAAGGISIGYMTGGAAAQGRGATAQAHGGDADTLPTVPDAPAPAPPSAGGITIGVLSGGAVAQGAEARAVHERDPQRVAAPEELLPALRELRGQLGLLARSADDGLDELADELDEVEAEIVRTDQVERGRLQWLRERLELGATTAAGLASAAAVTQVIVSLLG